MASFFFATNPDTHSLFFFCSDHHSPSRPFLILYVFCLFCCKTSTLLTRKKKVPPLHTLYVGAFFFLLQKKKKVFFLVSRLVVVTMMSDYDMYSEEEDQEGGYELHQTACLNHDADDDDDDGDDRDIDVSDSNNGREHSIQSEAVEFDAGSFDRDFAQTEHVSSLGGVREVDQLFSTMFPTARRPGQSLVGFVVELARYLASVELRPEDIREHVHPRVVKYLCCMRYGFRERKVNLAFSGAYFSVRDPGEQETTFAMNLLVLRQLPNQMEALEGTMLGRFSAVQLADMATELCNLYHLCADMAGRAAHFASSATTGNEPPVPQNQNVIPDQDAMNPDKLKPHQKLLAKLFERAHSQGLRRSETGKVYRPHRLPDGTNTKWYRYHMDVPQFIYRSVCGPEMDPEAYYALTLNRTTPSQMVNLLTELQDRRFPVLKKCRYQFSYRNGVYDAKEQIFYQYCVLAPPSERLRHVDDLDPFTSSANFFDVDMPLDLFSGGLDCAEAIPTPNIDKILLDQHFDQLTMDWFYALAGRLLFDVGTLDDWQCCAWIWGLAGTGKTSFINLMKEAYEETDTGTFMSDGQRDFPDAHLIMNDVKIAFGCDIDRNTNLTPTRFNLYMEGARMSFNVKFMTSPLKKWTAPFLWASNCLPPLMDTAGNVSRRTFIFFFGQPVKAEGHDFQKRCLAEMPLALVKFVAKYHRMVRLHGSKSNLYTHEGVLPDMLHKTRKQFVSSCSPLSGFLDSEEHVVMDPDSEVSVVEFQMRLRQYARDNGMMGKLSALELNPIEHGPIFTSRKLKLVVDPDTGRVVSVRGMAMQQPTGVVI